MDRPSRCWCIWSKSMIYLRKIWKRLRGYGGGHERGTALEKRGRLLPADWFAGGIGVVHAGRAAIEDAPRPADVLADSSRGMPVATAGADMANGNNRIVGTGVDFDH